MSWSAVATRSRASTTFSKSPSLIRPTASATTPSQAVPLSAPSTNATPLGGLGGWVGPTSGAVVIAARPIVVIQVVSPRLPTMTSGTTSTLSPGSSAKANEPKPTRPVPGCLLYTSDAADDL